MSKLLIASDPEKFTINEFGVIGSVAGKLGCSKWEKLNFAPDVRIQEDNVLVEFDINPHSEFESFNKNMIDGIEACRSVVNKIGYDLAEGVSSHIFTMDELRTFDKSAFVMGCDADYNALTGMINPKPEASDAGLRTAGGHIHLGYDTILNGRMPLGESQKIAGVMCDYFLGLPSLLMDKDDRRRELYGKAGSIRFKPYGIEYRTLSNFWIADDEHRRWAWDQATKAIDNTFGDFQRLVSRVSPDEIQRVINEGDKRAAEKYIKSLGVM
ncbi:MAG: putative amidoligase domain-containing protein [Bacteroidales bacterium]